MNESNILITGASGFVGSHLVAYFKEYHPGYTLFFLKRDENTPISTCPNQLLFSELEKKLAEIHMTAIIHLAGKAHDTSKTLNPESYFKSNYEFTALLFDQFLRSDAETFIFLSSIKSVHHSAPRILDEEHCEIPSTPYGQSKRKAEEYILGQKIPSGKRYFILRPVLIYGPGVKGNLRSLVSFVSKGIPYPFAGFENERSYLSIKNLCFIIAALLENKLPSSIFNLANDQPLSTTEIIRKIAEKQNMKPLLVKVPVGFWQLFSKIGDFLNLPFNSEVLEKLTGSMIVSNNKIISTLKMPLPEDSNSSIGNIV